MTEYRIYISKNCFELNDGIEREDKLKKHQEIEHRRTMCFSEYKMTEWRFENDDGKSDNHAMNVARIM